MKKKVLSVLLCCTLICSLMAVPNNPVQPPAHAELVMTAGGIAVVLVILAACGITFSSTEVGKKCVEQFGVDVPDVPQLAADILSASPAGHVLSITALTLPKVKQLVKEAIEYFKGKTSMDVANEKIIDFENYHVIANINDLTDEQVYNSCIYSINTDYSVLQNDIVYKFSLSINDDTVKLLLSRNGYTYTPFTSTIVKSTFDPVYRLGFYVYTDESGAKWMNPICSCKLVEKGLKKFTISSVKWNENFVPLISGNLNFVKSKEDIFSNILDSVDDINEAIAHSVGKAQEGIQADIQSVIDAVNQATATDTAISTDQARELLGIKDELAEIEAAQQRTIDAVKEGTKEDDMSVPQLPTTITDKFPFCVPFDLIALVKTFNATPVAPKVTVPVVFKSINYEHDFVFDFSGEDWDKFASVIRWGTLIFFLLGLTMVTRKMIKG